MVSSERHTYWLNIGTIYWYNVVRYGSNIGPILVNANIGPTLGRNIGPISCVTWVAASTIAWAVVNKSNAVEGHVAGPTLLNERCTSLLRPPVENILLLFFLLEKKK